MSENNNNNMSEKERRITNGVNYLGQSPLELKSEGKSEPQESTKLPEDSKPDLSEEKF